MDWFWFLAGFISGPAALACLAVLAALVMHLLGPGHGQTGCHVCDEAYVCEPSTHTRIGMWARTRRHNWVLCYRRAHREAWANNRWNPYRLPGVADADGGIAALRRARAAMPRRVWNFLWH